MKVGVVGAGNVGLRYVYAAIIRGLADQFVLIDIDSKRLKGEVMDLSHTAPYVYPVKIIAGDYSMLKGADLVMITAGKKQKPGQSRMDLAKENVELFKEIIPEIVKYAPQALLVVVSNPVDVLAYVTYCISGKPASQVIGSGTILDSARLRFELAKHCRVDARNVHAYILGEHGDSSFCVWSKASLGGMLIKDFCPYCPYTNVCQHQSELEKIFRKVRNAAYEIIEAKGETSYGIGLAMARIHQAILKDEHSILPLSVLVDNYLGINGLYMSLPAVISRNGIKAVLKLSLNEEEVKQCIASAQAIKKVIKQVGF